MSKTYVWSCIPYLFEIEKVVQVISDLVAIPCYHLSFTQPYFVCYQPKSLLYTLILMYKTYDIYNYIYVKINMYNNAFVW